MALLSLSFTSAGELATWPSVPPPAARFIKEAGMSGAARVVGIVGAFFVVRHAWRTN